MGRSFPFFYVHGLPSHNNRVAVSLWVMMISKTALKELAAYRQQRRCDEEGLFVVEGPKMAAEAMASGFGVRAVCATGEWLAAMGDRLPQGAACHEVSQSELERLSNFKSPNQVWMLVERTTPTAWSDIRQAALTLALDRLQDPGNLGTIMRTADWFGVRRIVCSHDTVGNYNPKAVQASMGAVFRTRVDYVDLPAWLGSCGLPVYGASLSGNPLSVYRFSPEAPAVLLIGNESQGIGSEAMACVTHAVLIPNTGGTAESLNASVAAGILMYAMIR
mgnify:CR=1 FL=1